jgi:hypothetical protein
LWWDVQLICESLEPDSLWGDVWRICDSPDWLELPPEERVKPRVIARRLKQQIPDKYGHLSEKQLQQLLSINKQLLAPRLKQKFPGKYKYDTEEQLRQLLSKTYRRKKNLDDLDSFESQVWAFMLGETDGVRAKLIGLIQAPAAKLARVFNAYPGRTRRREGSQAIPFEP